MAKYGMGWRRQLPDQRDQVFAAPPPILNALPEMVDLRHSGFSPSIYDQGQTSSCVGNSVAGLIHYDLQRQKDQGAGGVTPVPSRLMIYWMAREIEGTEQSDGGANIRDAIKAVAANGVCFEEGPDPWPFDPAAIFTKPPPNCYAAAKKTLALEYQAVIQTSNQLRACLAAGNPFVFGFTVYPDMESDNVRKSGRLPLPNANEAPIGGHAVDCWGYDNKNRCFLVRNSWGSAWGFKGLFLLPYEYLLNPELASDFWTIKTVGAKP